MSNLIGNFYKTTSILILAILIQGCNAIDKLTIFDIDYSDEIVIPSAIGINLPFNVFTPEISTNSESTFEINDTRKDLVEEIKIKKLKLSIISPANADFSFLNSINIYLNADGLDEMLLGWNNDIPNDAGNTIELELSNEDFQEFIKKDEINLRVNTVTDKLLLSDHELKVDAVFRVNAKILGV
ncbi:MAG: hypothetical protein U9R19_14335 [Bacteroidota bacterium]|nr:hypothetical protein [Bacteroidota bacterium]